jgi:hypothetical protein
MCHPLNPWGCITNIIMNSLAPFNLTSEDDLYQYQDSRSTLIFLDTSQILYFTFQGEPTLKTKKHGLNRKTYFEAHPCRCSY